MSFRDRSALSYKRRKTAFQSRQSYERMFAGERSNEKCFSSVLDPVPLFDLNSYLMDADEREILTEIERREEAKEKPCEMCNGHGVIRGHVCHFCLGRRIELTEKEYKTLIAVADDNRILNDEFIN